MNDRINSNFLLTILMVIILSACSGSAKPIPVTGPPKQEEAPDTIGDFKVYAPVIDRREQPTAVPTPPSGPPPSGGQGWYMAGANPERSSWTAEEVTGNLRIEWYRPIEAYISQNTQLIASNGMIYVSTARGLYALRADNGSLVWRFDTQIPLGNSPTVADSVIYVGGYDRKLYALNASTGALFWSFDGAQAGYSTNPVVVDGKVIAANRDGGLYAIGAHGSSSQGQLVWKFQAGGPIDISPAYKDGAVYFAALDNHAYSVNVTNGALLWKSAKLPGDGYHAFWPVIYRDKVIFSAAVSYRPDMNPGSSSVDGTNKDIRAIWPEQVEGTVIGSEVPSQAWANGFPTINANRLTEYYENSPASSSNPYTHKPWRRGFIVLDRASGTEFTFDSDGDGYEEYIPVFWWQTDSGTLYPGIVGSDRILYHNNAYRCCADAKGKVFGWNIDNPGLLSMPGARSVDFPAGGFGAMAEPQAISGGGNVIYRNLCCDRVGDWFSVTSPARNGMLWSYNLSAQAPGYDSMWFAYPESIARLWAWYQGGTDYYQDTNIDPYNYNSVNGIYASHGVQNPIIPYNGRLYVHRGNAIIAYGPGSGTNQLPLLTAENGANQVVPLSNSDLRTRLEIEVQKIVDAGHLRPGYYVIGQHNDFGHLASYFDNPGDTLYTLSIAYPHLSANLQAQVRSYLSSEFQAYFDPTMYVTTGWSTGAAREAMPMPDDIAIHLASNPIPPSINPGARFSWSYPPFNFYAMDRYAQNVPGVNKVRVYDLAKSKINAVLMNSQAVPTNYFREKPFEHNAYLSGYIGFLNLQAQAGMAQQDAALRTSVTNELNRLLSLKYNIFDKDSWWIENPGVVPNDPSRTNLYQRKEMDIARNFMWLTPELGDYLNQNLRNQVQLAVDEYNDVAPFWFVSRYQGFPGEGSTSVLWNYPAVFQAKAYILKEPRSFLTNYLDVPAFMRGDLFYLQNLVAAIQAP